MQASLFDLGLIRRSVAVQNVYALYRHEKQILSADQDMSALLNRIALYKQRAMLMFEVRSAGLQVSNSV